MLSAPRSGPACSTGPDRAHAFSFPLLAFAAIYFYALFYPPRAFFAAARLFGGAASCCFVASLAPVLVVFMRLMVTVPALALEGLSGWKAIQRSSDARPVRSGAGHSLLGRDAAEFSAAAALHHRAADPFPHLAAADPRTRSARSCGTAPAARSPRRPIRVMILSQILTFLAGSLILPLYSIATTLFYYDVRIRREGFDLEFMAGQLGGRQVKTRCFWFLPRSSARRRASLPATRRRSPPPTPLRAGHRSGAGRRALSPGAGPARISGDRTNPPSTPASRTGSRNGSSRLGAKFGDFKYASQMPRFRVAADDPLMVVLAIAVLLYIMVRLTRRRSGMEPERGRPASG